MNDGIDRHETVANALERGAGRDHGLTVEKFCERGEIVKGGQAAGKILFEVERHRPLGGAVYTRGEPMDAMQTYVARYALDLGLGIIEKLGDTTVDMMVNYSAVADEYLRNFSFSVIRLKGQIPKFRVTVSGLIVPFEVETLAQAEETIPGEMENLNFDSELTQFEAAGEDPDEVEGNFKKAHVLVGLRRLREARNDAKDEGDF